MHCMHVQINDKEGVYGSEKEPLNVHRHGKKEYFTATPLGY